MGVVVGVAFVYRVRRESRDVLAGAEGGIRFKDNACAESGVWCPSRLAGESDDREVVTENVGRADRVRSPIMGGRIPAWYSGGRCAGSGLAGI